MRELLRRRQSRVDGDAAGGQSVLVELPGAAEIGSAEEREPIRTAARVHHAKAGEAEIVGQVGGKAHIAVAEQRAGIKYLARRAVLDEIQGDRRFEEAAEMEELHRERAAGISP